MAIRIPRKPHDFRLVTGERIATPVLRHWFAMTETDFADSQRQEPYGSCLRVSKKSLFSLDESGDFGMKMGKK